MPDALRVAAGVADPILASKLLNPLPLETFDTEAATLFEPLIRQFGLQWSEEVLSALPIARGDAHSKWLAMLPRICQELSEAGEAAWALAQWLAVRQWEWIKKEMDAADKDPSPSSASAKLSALVPPLLAILRSAAMIGAFDEQELIVGQLAAARTERRVDALTALLRAIPKHDADLRDALRPIHALCTESLTARLSAPQRESGDWSIFTELGCRCERCRKLQAFLIARETRVFEWPLAKESRQHVHQIVERHELPVAHQTRRTGCPYTLVLTKREVLFDREAVRRKQWLKDLEWLKRALS
jgi:hypothetical protein